MATAEELPKVIQECDATLKEFSKKLGEEYEEGKELFATAKKMYQDVRYHIDHDLQELHKKNCTKENAQKDLEALLAKQQDLWAKLLSHAEAQKHRVEDLWAKVEAAEAAVNEERGMGTFKRSWGNYPTEQQHVIRNYHTHKLTPNLKEGKEKANEFIGFPDGYCTRVRLLNKQVKEQTEKAIQQIEKMNV